MWSCRTRLEVYPALQVADEATLSPGLIPTHMRLAQKAPGVPALVAPGLRSAVGRLATRDVRRRPPLVLQRLKPLVDLGEIISSAAVRHDALADADQASHRPGLRRSLSVGPISPAS